MKGWMNPALVGGFVRLILVVCYFCLPIDMGSDVKMVLIYCEVDHTTLPRGILRPSGRVHEYDLGSLL